MTPWDINVLVGCEESGAVREAFARRGFNAWSCDLKPDSSGVANPQHVEGDLLELLEVGAPNRAGHGFAGQWHLAIMHPPCTYLSASGLHWNKRIPGRAVKTEWALDFVRHCMDAAPYFYAIENPVGAIGSRIRKADQYVQPYEFGDDASKRTGLWLRGLPLLRGTERVPGRLVWHRGKQVERWSNQTDSGQNRLGPSEDRATIRSKTYPGIAEAMADQWGHFVYEYYLLKYGELVA